MKDNEAIGSKLGLFLLEKMKRLKIKMNKWNG